METVRVINPEPSPDRTTLWTPSAGAYTLGLGDYLISARKLDSTVSYGRVRNEAARILSKCLPPTHPDGRKTGLVIGYVQSGKTMSMTVVSALARDNGFRIIVAISGTTRNLYAQTSDRFTRDLRGGQKELNPWVILSNPNIHEHGRLLQRLVTDWSDSRLKEEDQQSLFISVMKHHGRLDNLAGLLAGASLAGVNALIIDDEADQAGLNTRPQDPLPSTTYSRIRRIRDCLPKHTFLQYTATAQAIILISLLDMLSPDFADVLETGDDYAGGREFFTDRTDLVHVIPPSQLPPLSTATLEPPPSLLHAMRLFFLGVAVARQSGSVRPRSMLVHPDRLKRIQRPYRRWIESIKERWGDVLRRAPDDPERTELVAEFQTPYVELTNSAGPIPPLDDLLTRLAVEIPRTLVTEVNSDTGSEVVWENAFAHILVGGDKLNRGYTVEGLTVTYMPRGPGTWTADTIQQRARFFGYKRLYLGYCRVFLQTDLQDAYRDYVEHEESLRSQVVEFRGRPTKELRRAFILDRRYRPTRPNILTEPYRQVQVGAGWFKQTAPHVVADLNANIRRVQEYIRSLSLRTHQKFSHQVARAVPLDAIKGLLGDYAFAQNELVEAHISILRIIDHLEASPTASGTVFVMQPDPRERKLREDSDTIQLFQGRSSKGASSYPGDEAIHDRSVTLQIHWLKVTKKEQNSHRVLADRIPGIAIYLPPDFGAQDWLIQPKRHA